MICKVAFNLVHLGFAHEIIGSVKLSKASQSASENTHTHNSSWEGASQSLLIAAASYAVYHKWNVSDFTVSTKFHIPKH